MPKYTVVRRIKGLLKRGEILEPGQIVLADEATAKPMLAIGALAACGEVKDAEATEQPATPAPKKSKASK